LRPEDYVVPNLLGGTYSKLGRKNEAEGAFRRSLEAAEAHLELFPNESRAWNLGAIAQAVLGNDDMAREWASKALEADPEEPLVLYNVACTYSQLGDIDDALDCLDEAITFGWGQKEWLEQDSDLDPLRDDPRFQALRERL
jgi:adenylate cyclase